MVCAVQYVTVEGAEALGDSEAFGESTDPIEATIIP
jgi:hypothetical protein